ncbi:hypothetical protein GGI04_001734 [Coemansia thaxteri]|uniref:Uncharacterized protein n=1 Tax=Coemansia thaxteri TaxID=2663907 RepID=A0A9W8BE41_9FUNG|nr:hypothetical protein H4R26_003676 [Coemansia thaxteri]KAJ2006850.1 hypothetical protein GGI04_001734 [Coemansia thaxteri]KAJ2470338.1 hypothetical protein GGI02_002993 [Coemansia sp. RSA 2322]KAJ2479551.1 hypothetical protein EV174_003988 [Coemansia sp. RSA 2320]
MYPNAGTAYPPPPPTYSQDAVEQVRRQRIAGVKRRYNISLGLQIAFTLVFAALLVYYIIRNRDINRSTDSNGYYYYNTNWFSWYIGLLIALLVIDLLSIGFTIRQRKRALAWLMDPNTPPHVIMMGLNPQSDYSEVVVMQPVQPVAYYQPQPGAPMYAPQPPPPMYTQPSAAAPAQYAREANMYMPSSPTPQQQQPHSGGYNDMSRSHLEKPI